VPRAKYALPSEVVVAAVMNGSQVHGQETKAGHLPADFCNNERRPWREAEFMKMVQRGGCCYFRWKNG